MTVKTKEKEPNLLNIFRGSSTGEVGSVSRDFDARSLLLVPVGDAHLGAPTCNIGKF